MSSPGGLQTADARAFRTGLRDYLTAAAVPGMGRWYRDYPWRVAGGDFAVGTDGNFGAIGWPQLHQQEETRVTIPVGAGIKQVTYRVGLIIGYQYRIPSQLPDGADEDAWVDGLDQLLDAVCAAVRADPTLGGLVWQAAEGVPNGGNSPQLIIKRDMPRKDRGLLHVWTAVEFDAVAMIRG